MINFLFGQIKARLQRKDNSSNIRSSCQSAQRYSPVPVITTTPAPHTSQPIKIPAANGTAPSDGVLRGTPGKARASVEGLNTVSMLSSCFTTISQIVSTLL